jgi:DNA-binding response OmpR family regulator
VAEGVAAAVAGAYFTGPAAVQSVIKRLRAKLRQLALPVHIVAARGLGFRLVLPRRATTDR